MMTGRQSIYIIGAQGIIALAVIASSTALGWHGTIDPASLMGLYGTVLGLAGAIGGSAAVVGQVVNGKAQVPVSELANREHTLRTAFAASAGAPAHTFVDQGAVETHEGGEGGN